MTKIEKKIAAIIEKTARNIDRNKKIKYILNFVNPNAINKEIVFSFSVINI